MSLQIIQSKLKAPKNQYNAFGKYHYRNQEDILEALKPILAELGYSLTLSDEVVEVGGRVYVKATCTLFNKTVEPIATNTGWAREPEERKGTDASQLTGATSSYARKYALNGLFLCDDTKDADALPPAQDEYISEDQHKQIMDYVDSFQSFDEATFLKKVVGGAESLDKIPASKFKQAMAALEAKARKEAA